jgi:hypothetical protein
MNRFYRLMSPAVAFSTVGTMLMFIAPLPTFRLYGGLATAGAYTMLIQVVLTSLLVVGIDDLHSQKRVWSGSLLEAADTSYGLRRALCTSTCGDLPQPCCWRSAWLRVRQQ